MANTECAGACAQLLKALLDSMGALDGVEALVHTPPSPHTLHDLIGTASTITHTLTTPSPTTASPTDADTDSADWLAPPALLLALTRLGAALADDVLSESMSSKGKEQGRRQGRSLTGSALALENTALLDAIGQLEAQNAALARKCSAAHPLPPSSVPPADTNTSTSASMSTSTSPSTDSQIAALEAEVRALRRENVELRRGAEASAAQLAQFAAQVSELEAAAQDDGEVSLSSSVWAMLSSAASMVEAAGVAAGTSASRLVRDVAQRRRPMGSLALTAFETEQLEVIQAQYKRHIDAELPPEFEAVAGPDGGVVPVSSVRPRALDLDTLLPIESAALIDASEYAAAVAACLARVTLYHKERASRTLATVYDNDPINLVCLELAGWLAGMFTSEPHRLAADVIAARRRYLSALIETDIFASASGAMNAMLAAVVADLGDIATLFLPIVVVPGPAAAAQ